MIFMKRKAEKYKKVGVEGLKSGDFAIINYKSKLHGDGERFILVLNPNWEGYLHAIKMDFIDRGKLLRILKRMGQTDKEGRSAKRRAVAIGNPYKFYHLRVKPVIKKMKDTPYRTYQIKQIDNISKFDYKI